MNDAFGERRLDAAFEGAVKPAHSKGFIPPWWLRNPHAQSIWARLVRRRNAVALRREVLCTPDDDDLIVDHLDGRDLRFILLHGLEGSSNSVYIQGLLQIIAARGFAASVMHFRSCAHDPRNLARMLMNRRPRLYHSGDTDDLDFLLRRLSGDLPLVAIGVSLGGNALLKWLGENPDQQDIRAAATMSVPYDLAEGARYLERGIGPLYVARFLRTMKPKTRSVVERFGVTLDLQAAMRSRSFLEFDNASTAPLHGFRDADDYYARASSIGFLAQIATPALCISAADDPFLPSSVLDRARAAASPSIEFCIPRSGGHTGFVAGRWPWMPEYWAEELMVQWLLQRTTSR